MKTLDNIKNQIIILINKIKKIIIELKILTSDLIDIGILLLTLLIYVSQGVFFLARIIL